VGISLGETSCEVAFQSRIMKLGIPKTLPTKTLEHLELVFRCFEYQPHDFIAWIFLGFVSPMRNHSSLVVNVVAASELFLQKNDFV